MATYTIGSNYSDQPVDPSRNLVEPSPRIKKNTNMRNTDMVIDLISRATPERLFYGYEFSDSLLWLLRILLYDTCIQNLAPVQSV